MTLAKVLRQTLCDDKTCANDLMLFNDKGSLALRKKVVFVSQTVPNCISKFNL